MLVRRPTPADGEVRHRTRFAFLPTRVEGDLVILFERYTETQRYNFSPHYSHWHTIQRTRWVHVIIAHGKPARGTSTWHGGQ